MGEDGGEVKIHNESGGEAMKQQRKVVIEHIEKDIIYVHNLIEVLVKKFGKELISYEKNSQK